MSNTIEFDESLRKTLAALDGLPDKLQKSIVRGAVRASAKPMLAAARENVPVVSGTLRDSIRITSDFDRKTGEVSVKVVAGGKTKGGGDAYYAHMVEYGTKPHRISGPSLLFKRWVKDIKHPGSPPSGFMRKAFDGFGQASIDAYAEYIRKRLTKAGIEGGGDGGG